jgi:hypothetical protein
MILVAITFGLILLEGMADPDDQDLGAKGVWVVGTYRDALDIPSTLKRTMSMSEMILLLIRIRRFGI